MCIGTNLRYINLADPWPVTCIHREALEVSTNDSALFVSRALLLIDKRTYRHSCAHEEAKAIYYSNFNLLTYT